MPIDARAERGDLGRLEIRGTLSPAHQAARKAAFVGEPHGHDDVHAFVTKRQRTLPTAHVGSETPARTWRDA